jgi:FixJ family two-component response regulator
VKDDRKNPRSLGAMTASRQMRWRHPILVLDADREGGEQAAEVLIAAGLEVELLQRPEELLQRAATHPSTVMVIEIPLTGMSESVLLSTAARMTGLKVMPIVLTSRKYGEDSSVAKALLAQGAVDFVGRPASSQRWRSALARALAKLQTESAKLASLSKASRSRGDSTRDQDLPVPPMVFRSAPTPSGPGRAGRPTSSAPRSHDALGPRPAAAVRARSSRNAGEVLRPDELKELESRGFKVPGDAIAATVLGGPARSGPTLVWRATERTMALACVDHSFDQGGEVRLTFLIPDPGKNRDGKPRILGRVVGAQNYPWGYLVDLALIGAAPKADYNLLISAVDETGGWALDWNRTGWTLD